MFIKKYIRKHTRFLSTELYKIASFYLIEKGVNTNTLDRYFNSILDYVMNEHKSKYKSVRIIDKELYNLLKKHGALRGKDILKKQRNFLSHYKNSYGSPYIIKGVSWCHGRYDKYLDDFVKIFKEKAKNNISYLDKKEIPVESYEVNNVLKKIFPLGDFYRSFSCKNDKCKVIYYMYSDIKKANKYWEFDLKLEGGYFFPIIYIFEREIDLKEKNNDRLKYMLSC